MTDDEKMAFVQQLYATTGAGDFDTAETMLTDDFFIIEADGLPMAGEFAERPHCGISTHTFWHVESGRPRTRRYDSGWRLWINLVSFRFGIQISHRDSRNCSASVTAKSVRSGLIF